MINDPGIEGSPVQFIKICPKLNQTITNWNGLAYVASGETCDKNSKGQTLALIELLLDPKTQRIKTHRDVLHIHPEADPGHDHNEDGGHVALHQVETNATMKLELGRQAAVVT